MEGESKSSKKSKKGAEPAPEAPKKNQGDIKARKLGLKKTGGGGEGGMNLGEEGDKEKTWERGCALLSAKKEEKEHNSIKNHTRTGEKKGCLRGGGKLQGRKSIGTGPQQASLLMEEIPTDKRKKNRKQRENTEDQKKAPQKKGSRTIWSRQPRGISLLTERRRNGKKKKGGKPEMQIPEGKVGKNARSVKSILPFHRIKEDKYKPYLIRSGPQTRGINKDLRTW